MMNDEEGGNYEEITEQMIDVKDILNLYASPDILSKGISYKLFLVSPRVISKVVLVSTYSLNHYIQFT